MWLIRDIQVSDALSNRLKKTTVFHDLPWEVSRQKDTHGITCPFVVSNWENQIQKFMQPKGNPEIRCSEHGLWDSLLAVFGMEVCLFFMWRLL